MKITKEVYLCHFITTYNEKIIYFSYLMIYQHLNAKLLSVNIKKRNTFKKSSSST